MDEKLAAVARFGQPFAILLIDLDGFKGYNDTHGHGAGDVLLCRLADRIRSELRPTDSLARMGGDEFAVLIAGVDRDGATPLVRRIRRAIADGAPHSAGIASAPTDGLDTDTLYPAADRDPYAEKRGHAGPSPRRRVRGSRGRSSLSDRS